MGNSSMVYNWFSLVHLVKSWYCEYSCFSSSWTSSKFINHSCNPNCEVDIIDNEIWISSIKRIKKGAELFYNYGYPFDTDFVDHICKCGSRNCVGYILSDNDWPKLKKELKKNRGKL